MSNANMESTLKRCTATSSQAAQVNQHAQPPPIDITTLSTPLQLHILLETCVAEVQSGLDHNQVLSKLSDVCAKWRRLVEEFRPTFVDKILEADPTYDMGPESTAVEVALDDKSEFPEPHETPMVVTLAAGGDRLYLPVHGSRSVVVLSCVTSGWNVQTRRSLDQRPQFSFSPTRRLVEVHRFRFSCVTSMQASNSLQSLYFVQTTPENTPEQNNVENNSSNSDQNHHEISGDVQDNHSHGDHSDHGNNGNFEENPNDNTDPLERVEQNPSEVQSGSHVDDEIGPDLTRPIVIVNYVWRINTIDGSVMSRWRIDGCIRFPANWFQTFMTVEHSTGNVIIADSESHRILEYSANGELLHIVNVGRVVPVIKAFRLPASAVDRSRRNHDVVDDVRGERLSYVIVVRDDEMHFGFRRICCNALENTETTPIEVMASFDSDTQLFDVIDVCHGNILFAEWSHGCDCCLKHCHVRLHRVEDLEPSRRDDVHEPVFHRCQRSTALSYDRDSRILYIADDQRIHCVNIWRNIV